jgi:molybdopterin-biosynthesis enzyme MoeA-like protein
MCLRFAFLLVLTFSLSGTSWAWFDKTHIAIAKAAGYKQWFNAAGADMAKIKAGALEERNHYFNNYNNTNVTAAMVIDQAKRYNDPLDNAPTFVEQGATLPIS